MQTTTAARHRTLRIQGTRLDTTAARRLLGPDALIGVSCYDSLVRARAAEIAAWLPLVPLS